MTDWPDDWFRDGPKQAGLNSPGDPLGANPPGGPATQTAAGPAVPLGGQAGDDQVTQPAPSPRQAARPGGAGAAGDIHGAPTWAGGAGGSGGAGGTARGAPAGDWPEQPAMRTTTKPPRPGRRSGVPGPVRTGWRRWLRPKPILIVLAVLISLGLITSIGTYFYLDSKLTRKNVLMDYPGRPAPGAGQNWLITGSDSRQGLTRAQLRHLAAGFGIGGQRSDTIMLLHLPANGGRPVLISIPRDSYVKIPGHGYNKINAAFAFGGPALLAETIQDDTGLYINHYMGIGFGGFVRVVNAVGGVEICLKAPLVDPASGLHLHAGCQVLDGAKALGFVRSRHTFATQDLQRVQNQRIFLRALLRKMTSTGVLLDPFKSYPAAADVAGTLTVDQGTSLYQLVHVAFALRNPITTTVPVGNANYLTQNAGDALLWNTQQASQLWHDLRTDQPIPKSLITGSAQAG